MFLSIVEHNLQDLTYPVGAVLSEKKKLTVLFLHDVMWKSATINLFVFAPVLRIVVTN